MVMGLADADELVKTAFVGIKGQIPVPNKATPNGVDVAAYI